MFRRHITADQFFKLKSNMIEVTSESSPASPLVLNFGYLPECCHHTHTLAVKNLSNFDIPLLFTIKKQSNNLQMFSVLETSDDTLNYSQLEKNTSALCILHTGQTLAITVIFSSPEINLLKSQSGKADVSALLDIQLAGPLSNIILKEITLMGKVGYTNLLLNQKYIPLVFNFEIGKSMKTNFPLKNEGCIGLNLAIKVDGTSIVDCLAIKPNRLHIPPGKKSFIELKFQPETEHPCEGKLMIEIEPHGILYCVTVICFKSALTKRSTPANMGTTRNSAPKEITDETSTPKNAAPERSALRISYSRSNQKSLTKNVVGNSDYSLKNLDSTSKSRCGLEVDSISRSGYEGSTSLKTQSDGVSEPIETPCKVNSKFPVTTTHKQLVWGSVRVGKQKIESCVLRNESNSTVKLKACLDDIFNSFKLINDQGQCFNELEIILHSMERVKFNVAFNPPKPGSAIARVMIKKLSSSRGSSNFELPLHGYGGHVKVAVKGVSKDATGQMWLSMGQLDATNSDMYSEFILSNSGTLDAFAMIKVIPKGLEVTESNFSINTPLLVIGAGASVSVTVAFNLQREVYKNLTLNSKDVNEIGVLEITTGDEPSRQRIKSMWNTNKNSDLEAKLTNWSLPQLCNIFPGEITLSKLEFLNDPDRNIVRMLYRSFICQEISLTVEKNVDKSYFAKPMLVECGAEGNSQMFTSLYSETEHNAAS